MCYGLVAGPWLICEKIARKKYSWAWADLPKNGLVDLRKDRLIWDKKIWAENNKKLNGSR